LRGKIRIPSMTGSGLVIDDVSARLHFCLCETKHTPVVRCAIIDMNLDVESPFVDGVARESVH
jgi:hypothetical protein